jgi:hypothetical protein
MTQHLAVGVYGTLDEAEAAVRSLGSGLSFALLGGAEAGGDGPITGLLGWLYQLGLFKENVEKYNEAIKAGKFLVIVHGSEGAAKAGRDALAGSRAEQLDLHAPATGPPPEA